MPLAPRKYQQEGISFLRQHKRAMLCDLPGLGKTLQASMAAETPCLIACPTYLTQQWADFLGSQWPASRIALCTGTRVEKNVKLKQVADWYIINIEMLRLTKDKDFTFKLPRVKTVIFDESHHLKNKEASQSQGALKVAKATPRVYLLTGTPIVKDADDLYFQLKIICPDSFTSYHRFVDSFMQTVATPWTVKVVGVRDAKGLRKLLAQHALGRNYRQVGLQLPDLIETVHRLDMPSDLMKQYTKLKQEYRLKDKVYDYAIQIISELRQMTFCETKIKALIDCILDAKMSGVIFTWYRETAQIIGEALEVPVLTGDISPNERAKVARKSNLVVATLASLSEGVDMSHLRNVVFVDQDYTSGRLYQALSRVRRYSENNEPVKVHYLLMKDTIDETIYNMVQRRVYDAKMILREELRA